MNTFREALPAPDGRPSRIIELPWGDIDLNARAEQDSRIEAEIANKFGSLIGGLHSRYAEHVLREEKFVPESATISSVTGRMHTGYYLSLQLPTNSYDPEGSYWSVRVSSLGAVQRLSMRRVEDYRSHEAIEYFMDADNTVRRQASGAIPIDFDDPEIKGDRYDGLSTDEMLDTMIAEVEAVIRDPRQEHYSGYENPKIEMQELNSVMEFLYGSGSARAQTEEDLNYQRTLARLECHLHTENPKKFSELVYALVAQPGPAKQVLTDEFNHTGGDERAIHPYYGPKLLQVLVKKVGLEFGLTYYAHILQEARIADVAAHEAGQTGIVMAELGDVVTSLVNDEFDPRETRMSFTVQDGVLVPELSALRRVNKEPIANTAKTPPVIDRVSEYTQLPIEQIPEWDLLTGADVQATPDVATAADLEAEAKRTKLTIRTLFEASGDGERQLLSRLSSEDFNQLRMLTKEVLADQDIFDAFSYLMVIHDISKNQRVYAAVGAGPHVDHDTVFTMLMSDEHTAARQELLPTFDTLSTRGQELIKHVARSTFNYPQVLQGEVPPATLEDIHNEQPLVRDVEILKGIYDIAGAAGHINQNESVTMTSATWQRMNTLNDALRSSGFNSPEERYHAFLDGEIMRHTGLRPEAYSW